MKIFWSVYLALFMGLAFTLGFELVSQALDTPPTPCSIHPKGIAIPMGRQTDA
jgi:hypothetical protein